MVAAQVLITIAGVYALVGLVFALVFLPFGARRIDPAARGAAWGFYVLIFPGTAVLWPVVLAKWARAVRADRREESRT